MEKHIRDYGVICRERLELAALEEVSAIDKKIMENPHCGDLWMERGLALSKQRLFRHASDSYSCAIMKDPFKGIYYRHRGHRFISCFRFEDACADFVLASRLIPENWDVWYHLGLSYFLLGDYENAACSYKTCLDITDKNDDGAIIAVSNWLWITLMRLGEKEKAQAVIDNIGEDMDYGENISYYNLLLMYKGLINPDELLALAENDQDFVTMGFGLSNYYSLIGQCEKTNETIDAVFAKGEGTDNMYAFGYIAATVDRKNAEISAEGCACK